jgi:DNA-binding CsgD family transcriptional regulator
MKYYTLGFGFCTSWLWMFFLQGPLLNHATSLCHLSSDSLFLIFLFSHSANCFIISQCPKIRNFFILPSSITGEVFLLGVLSLLLLRENGFLTITPFAAAICAALAGFGAAPFFISWMEKFSHLPLTTAIKSLALSLCMAGVSTIGIVYIPVQIAIVLLICTLMLSLCCFYRANIGSTKIVKEIISLPIIDFISFRLIVLVALLYIAGGSIFSTMSVEDEYPYFFYLSNLAYMGACLLSIYLFRNTSVPDLHLLFRPILPLIGIGFLMFPLLPKSWAWTSFALLQGGTAFLDLYTWLLFASLCRTHAHPHSVCAFGIGVITSFIFCGNLISTAIAAFITTIPHLNITCLIAGIACLVATQFFVNNWTSPKNKILLPEEKNLSDEVKKTSAKIAPSAPIKTTRISVHTIEEVHAQYQHGNLQVYLTPRERQILLLLSQSYSARIIAEKLFISHNTVKFHIKNIYQKFGVTNRHDLLDAVFKKEEEHL